MKKQIVSHDQFWRIANELKQIIKEKEIVAQKEGVKQKELVEEHIERNINLINTNEDLTNQVKKLNAIIDKLIDKEKYFVNIFNKFL